MDAVETTNTVVFLGDDGIVRIVSKGKAGTAESVSETLAAVGRVSAGIACPVLFDARIQGAWGPEAWRAFIEGASPVVTAAAVLYDPEDPPQPGQYLDLINRLLIPIRMFTDDAEALAFLRRPDD